MSLGYHHNQKQPRATPDLHQPESTKPSLSNADNFWESFHLKPAAVPLQPPFDYDAETELLSNLCKTFVDAASSVTDSAVAHMQYVSDDFALESPLTPPSSIAAAVESGTVGDTFKKVRFSICRCRRDTRAPCERDRYTDWYRGPCGSRVVREEPYSFIHVNLSRKVDSIAKFVSLVDPVFRAERVPFMMIPGDSDLTVALVSPSRSDEKSIRRLLREKRFRIDNGIRIFQITTTIAGRKGKLLHS